MAGIQSVISLFRHFRKGLRVLRHASRLIVSMDRSIQTSNASTELKAASTTLAATAAAYLAAVEAFKNHIDNPTAANLAMYNARLNTLEIGFASPKPQPA